MKEKYIYYFVLSVISILETLLFILTLPVLLLYVLSKWLNKITDRYL